MNSPRGGEVTGSQSRKMPPATALNKTVEKESKDMTESLGVKNYQEQTEH